MKNRRKPRTKKNPELSAFMQKCRGKRTISEVGKAAGDGGYYRHETLGSLPRNPAKIQKIADVLGCKTEELTAFVKLNKTTPLDILPIVKTIAECSCEGLTVEEFDFLFKIQRKLPTPMSPQLIKELLTNRRASETKDDKNEDWLMPTFKTVLPTPEELFLEALAAQCEADHLKKIGMNDCAHAAHMRADAFLEEAINLERSYGN